MIDIDTIDAIDRTEMTGLATTEYGRLLDLLRALSEEEWNHQTVCDDWTVKLMVSHLLGAAESAASFSESMRQLHRGKKLAAAKGTEIIDGINAVQVDEREQLSPAELISRIEATAPKAVAKRHRTPSLVRRVSMPDGIGGKITMGHLVDVVYTRDQWLHRIDIANACNRAPLLTEDHDARIVADVVREWAEKHGESFDLVLGGPAGGEYSAGQDGPYIEMDAVEFCLILSARLDKEMPLNRPIVF